MNSDYYIAITTCPNIDVATQLARNTVEQQLAACVNIIPAIQSIYRWQGQIENDIESLLILKTTRNHLNELESYIKKHHPYEVPEFIVINIESGSQAYLDWITNSLKQNILN